MHVVKRLLVTKMHPIPGSIRTLYQSGNVENAEFNIHSQQDSLWTSSSGRRRQSLHTYPGDLSRDFLVAAACITLQLPIRHLGNLTPTQHSQAHNSTPRKHLLSTQWPHNTARLPKFPWKCLLIAASTMFLPRCLDARRDCAQRYLLESLHVLEVESNVKKAQVGIDEFKLQRRRGLKTSDFLNQLRWVLFDSLRKPKKRKWNGTYKHHLDDKVVLVGTLQPVVLWMERGKVWVEKLSCWKSFWGQKPHYLMHSGAIKTLKKKIVEFKRADGLLPMSLSQYAIFLYTSSHTVTVSARSIFGMNLVMPGSSWISITTSWEAHQQRGKFLISPINSSPYYFPRLFLKKPIKWVWDGEILLRCIKCAFAPRAD